MATKSPSSSHDSEVKNISELLSTKKIAIIRSSSIGDVIVATACLDLLKQMNLLKHLCWVGKEPTLSILKRYYPEIQTVDMKSESQLSTLIKNVALVVDLQRTMRSKLLSTKIQIRNLCPASACPKKYLRRAALIIKSRISNRSLNTVITDRRIDQFQFQMMVQTVMSGLKKINIPTPASLPTRIHPNLPSFVDYAQISLKDDLSLVPKFRLVVAPGAAHPTKRAPKEVFQKILKYLDQELANLYGKDLSGVIEVVFLGSMSEKNIIDEITLAQSWHFSFRNMAGTIELHDVCELLRNCQVTLSNDSALAHISEAVGTPVAVLFGPTSENFGFAPWKIESASFSSNLACRPCSKHGKSPCRFQDKACFSLIDPESVAQHLLKFLK